MLAPGQSIGNRYRCTDLSPVIPPKSIHIFLGVIPVASCRASNVFLLDGFADPTRFPFCPPWIVIERPVVGFVPTAFHVFPLAVERIILNLAITSVLHH
jgi:hypothetical protein